MPIGLPLPTLKVGQSATDFSVPDANGHLWRLSDLRGQKNVLLTFFPKCFTGGCATHLSGLQDHLKDFDATQTQVLSVSVDPAEGDKGQIAFAKQWDSSSRSSQTLTASCLCFMAQWNNQLM